MRASGTGKVVNACGLDGAVLKDQDEAWRSVVDVSRWELSEIVLEVWFLFGIVLATCSRAPTLRREVRRKRREQRAERREQRGEWREEKGTRRFAAEPTRPHRFQGPTTE
jgi:hypothetical protein